MFVCGGLLIVGLHMYLFAACVFRCCRVGYGRGDDGNNVGGGKDSGDDIC